MSVTVENIEKFYGAQKALDQVSFSINAGEIVGFIGPNGAGKSTMMKIITGSLSPTSGIVSVCDMNVEEYPVEVKQKIGYLPENNPLYLTMYVREYLEFMAGLHKVKNVRKRIDEIIGITGITPERHKKIGALSKGYRQRVGLAQALIHDPAVLILDEPTTGLDPNQIVEIRNLISEVGRQKTVMLSTHIMQEVEAICHRVIIINKGVIIANDQAANITSHSRDKAQTVFAEFNGPVQEKQLLAIKGVSRAILVKDNAWLIETDSDEDIRTDIFNFAVSARLAVLSMQKKEKRLEEVFRELTK